MSLRTRWIVVAVVILVPDAGAVWGLTRAVMPSSADGETAQSCVGEQLHVDPRTASPGDKVTVQGDYFTTGCSDSVENGNPRETPVPDTDVRVVLRQGSESWPLATVNASGGMGSFSTAVVIPMNAEPGEASVSASGANATIEIAAR